MFQNIDIASFHWINSYFVFSWLDSVMVYITDFNHFRWWLVIGILGLIVFGKRYERVSMFLLLIAVMFGDIFGNFFKHLFIRIRPEHVLDNVRMLLTSSSSFSFPSNHAVNTAAVATVLILRYPKQKLIGICAIIISFLVSYSRIYVGVHYPSDIIFGWPLGIGCAWVTVQILRKWDWRNGTDTKTIFGIKYGYLLLFLTIIITLFRLKYIQGGTLDLAAEEAQYWNWSRHLDWSYYSKGPMIAYLIFIFTKLAGNTVFAIRLGAVVISSILTYVTYLFAKQLFASKRIGFFSALVINLIPLFSAGAILMTTDTPLLLFWALTIYLVYLAITSAKSGYWYLAGITFGLGLLSKYTMVILIPVFLIYFLLDKEQRIWLKKKEIYLSLLLGLIVFSPVLYWNYSQSWVSGRHLLGLSNMSQGMNISIRYSLDYIGSQIGIITPWIFAGLIYAWWVIWYPPYRISSPLFKFPAFYYLWCTSAPVFLLFLLKSIQGKVQANWAAPAYYTGLILTVAIFDKKYKAATSAKEKKKIAIYTWSSILITGLLVLFIHNPDYLAKLKVPMKAKYDVTNRLRGWHELGTEVSVVKREMMNEPSTAPVFIFSDSYQIASELSFYVSGQPETYCINLGRRLNQYDLWDGWNTLLGWNAIYVVDKQQYISDTVSRSFTTCEMVKQVPIYLNNEIIREFSIYKCYNFKGLINPAPTSY
jgi:4-amino-4-deoxy-L-arabinose transferase-like glycosyltransferase